MLHFFHQSINYQRLMIPKKTFENSKITSVGNGLEPCSLTSHGIRSKTSPHSSNPKINVEHRRKLERSPMQMIIMLFLDYLMKNILKLNNRKQAPRLIFQKYDFKWTSLFNSSEFTINNDLLVKSYEEKMDGLLGENSGIFSAWVVSDKYLGRVRDNFKSSTGLYLNSFNVGVITQFILGCGIFMITIEYSPLKAVWQILKLIITYKKKLLKINTITNLLLRLVWNILLTRDVY